MRKRNRLFTCFEQNLVCVKPSLLSFSCMPSLSGMSCLVQDIPLGGKVLLSFCRKVRDDTTVRFKIGFQTSFYDKPLM